MRITAGDLSISTARSRVTLSFSFIIRITSPAGHNIRLPGSPALHASVSTLLITSRGADGVKRKPGHWFSPKMLTRTHVSCCSIRRTADRMRKHPGEPGSSQRMPASGQTQHWNSQTVGLRTASGHASCLSGSCHHEADVVWPACPYCHIHVNLY